MWDDVKSYVASRDTSCNFSRITSVSEERFSIMCEEDCVRNCEHLKKIEHAEPHIDNLVESMVMSPLSSVIEFSKVIIMKFFSFEYWCI